MTQTFTLNIQQEDNTYQKFEVSKEFMELLFASARQICDKINKDTTNKEVMEMIRKKTTIDEKDALFLQVRAKFSITGEKTIGDIYDTYKDSDGFLYIMYTTELIYG